LEEFGAASWNVRLQKQRCKDSERFLGGFSGSLWSNTDSLRREKSSWVAALEESGAATWDVRLQKKKCKDSGRFLSRV